MRNWFQRRWHAFLGVWVVDTLPGLRVPYMEGVCSFFVCGGWTFRAEVCSSCWVVVPNGALMRLPLEGEGEAYLMAMNKDGEVPDLAIHPLYFCLKVVEGVVPCKGSYIARDGRKHSEALVVRPLDPDQKVILCEWRGEAGLISKS